mmetsp:Transcript_32604/g.51933  ORF Transcript_32604/g.51933 Transcript_32604/m.51933 type:complete len:108 (+) Transcript_32604:1085-1408(+)
MLMLTVFANNLVGQPVDYLVTHYVRIGTNAMTIEIVIVDYAQTAHVFPAKMGFTTATRRMLIVGAIRAPGAKTNILVTLIVTVPVNFARTEFVFRATMVFRTTKKRA